MFYVTILNTFDVLNLKCKTLNLKCETLNLKCKTSVLERSKSKNTEQMELIFGYRSGKIKKKVVSQKPLHHMKMFDTFTITKSQNRLIFFLQIYRHHNFDFLSGTLHALSTFFIRKKISKLQWRTA